MLSTARDSEFKSSFARADYRYKSKIKYAKETKKKFLNRYQKNELTQRCYIGTLWYPNAKKYIKQLLYLNEVLFPPAIQYFVRVLHPEIIHPEIIHQL